jgi:polyhydroxyalkanoate synthesis regulator protein
LPIPFLRQLIRFYDDSIARMVPSYLQFSLEHLAKEQVRFREQFASAFSNPAAAFEFYQQQARQNMAMFEQAMSMWASFGTAASGRGTGKPGDPSSPQPQAAAGGTASEGRDELNELKSQLSAMQQKIEKLSQSRP